MKKMRSFEALEDRQMLTVSLVSDINTQPADSDIQFVASLDNVEIFLADDGIHGRELWRTDGTTAGTYRLGPTGHDALSLYSNPIVIAGDNLFVRIGDSLFVTDGTSTGSRWLFDLRSIGSIGDTPMFSLGDKLCFAVRRDGGQTSDLWISDGTPDGTNFLRSLGIGFVNRWNYINGDQSLIFRVSSFGAPDTLWKTDGTSTGTVPLFDSSETGSIANVHGFQDHVLIQTTDSADGDHLWIWDHESNESHRLLSVPSESLGRTWLAETDDFLLFHVIDSEGEKRLWSTDGSEAGTMELTDAKGVGESGHLVTAVRDIVFFEAHDARHGTELWRTDGTRDGTFILKDIFEGPRGSVGEFAVIGDELVFFADDGIHGKEPWISDGTSLGTHLLADTYEGVNGIVVHSVSAFGNRVYYSDSRGDVWRTDGSAQGTRRVLDSEILGAHFYRMLVAGDMLLLLAIGRDENGRVTDELWTLDGVEKPILQRGFRYQSVQFNIRDEQTLIVADDGFVGRELWILDNRTREVRFVEDINRMNSSSNPENLLEVNGNLYFSADNGDQRQLMQLVQGDGVQQFAESKPEWFTESFSEAITVNGLTLFSAAESNSGHELWATSELAQTPWQVADIFQGISDSSPRKLMSINGQVYFVADDREGSWVWTFDSNSLEVNRFSAVRSVTGIGTFRDSVLIMSENAEGGEDLWVQSEKSDSMFLRSFSGKANNGRHQFTESNGRVFFVGHDIAFGEELWVTDGTQAGTALVRDIHPTSDADIRSLTALNGSVYFGANHPDHGLELWRSDGTDLGTQLVLDINPGASSSLSGDFLFPDANRFLALDDAIYFATFTDVAAIWRTNADGSVSTQVARIENVTSPVVYLTVAGDRIYFLEEQYTSKLWSMRFDGSDLKVSAADIPWGLSSIYGIDIGIVSLGDWVFFVRDSPFSGVELWKTGADGSSEMVVDLTASPASLDSFPHNLHRAGARLLFATRNGSEGSIPYATDGTAIGTRRLDARFDGVPSKMLSLGEGLLVVGSDRETGRELRWADLASRQIFVVRDVVPGHGSIDEVVDFVAFDDAAYFVMFDEVWVTDGTQAGTFSVSERWLPSDAINRRFLRVELLGGKVIALALEGGISLWQFDPSLLLWQRLSRSTFSPMDVEIFVVAEEFAAIRSQGGFRDSLVVFDNETNSQRFVFPPDGTLSSRIHGLVAFHSQVCFVADVDRQNIGLWTTDGTVGGTKLVPFAQPLSRIDDMYATDDGVFFMATTENWGRELFHYDGASIQLVADLNPGTGNSDLLELISSNGVVWASIDDGTHGAELWQFDLQQGTAALVEDLIPGPVGSNPAQLTLVGTDTVYFAADSVPYGVELFRFQSEDSHSPGDFNRDAVLDVADVDLLYAALRNGTNEPNFDLNQDEVVNQHDVDYWVRQLFGSNYGDANLDGIFDSSDLVQVFQRGEYEDGIDGNSTWSDGDWNADGEFSTADLVLAFQADSYVTAASSDVLGNIILDPNDQRWAKRPRSAWLA